jgi:hypothetical protein
MGMSIIINYMKEILLGVISRFHPDLHTSSLTHLVRHATLHQSYKYKMIQHPEEGFSYVDFYSGA